MVGHRRSRPALEIHEDQADGLLSFTPFQGDGYCDNV